MGKEVSVRERTDRERTDMERMDRERTDVEVSSGGTNMQTRALHRYAETTEARDHQGSTQDFGTLQADMRAC